MSVFFLKSFIIGLIYPPSATDLKVGSQSPTLVTIGRIRVQLDSARDYLEMTDEAHSRCLATLNIANAATFEVIEADGGIELRFTVRYNVIFSPYEILLISVFINYRARSQDVVVGWG